MCRLSVWLLNIMFQNVKPLLFEIIWLIRFAWCFTNTMICEEWTDALEVEVGIENGGEWFCIEIWQYLEKDEKWRKSCRRSQIRMKRVEQKRTFLCFCLLRVTSEMFSRRYYLINNTCCCRRQLYEGWERQRWNCLWCTFQIPNFLCILHKLTRTKRTVFTAGLSSEITDLTATAISVIKYLLSLLKIVNN